MQYFCETRHCRRHLLLSYFDESMPKEPGEPKANCCDNCDKLYVHAFVSSFEMKRARLMLFFTLCRRNRDPNMKPAEKLDLTREIKLLLDVFDYFNGRFGLGVPIKFLLGLKDSKISELQMKNKLFGAGKDRTEAAWKALGWNHCSKVTMFSSFFFTRVLFCSENIDKREFTARKGCRTIFQGSTELQPFLSHEHSWYKSKRSRFPN